MWSISTRSVSDAKSSKTYEGESVHMNADLMLVVVPKEKSSKVLMEFRTQWTASGQEISEEEKLHRGHDQHD
jgi:hypothetical protein